MISEGDSLRFDALCRAYLRGAREEGRTIGLLREKRLHALLKDFVCPDKACQEVSLFAKAGEKYVSDAVFGGVIYEVQTGSFFPLREKIAYYLAHTDLPIVVVHPLIVKKRLNWIDPADGSVAESRPSTKKETVWQGIAEIFWLRECLGERLRFRFPMMEAEEFRLLNGWSADRKRGSERYEIFPTALSEEITVSSLADFRALIPETLPEVFTVAQFAKATKLRGRKQPYSAVKVLCTVGAIEQAEKIGRANAYRRL